MAQVQIDEAELLNHRTVTAAVNEILANPKSRRMLLEARKTANPNVVIPEIDAATPVQDELAKLRAEMAADRAERAREAAERAEAQRTAEFTRQWESQRRALSQQGWRDEGIAEVEKHARERGIPDLEVAAAHFEKLHPPPEPVIGGSASWGFFDAPPADDTFVKNMIESRGENESALNAEINAVLKDIRGQQGARR